MAPEKATSDVPVFTHINKPIRNLRKTPNRIALLENSIPQGKSVSTIKNKEQEELLKSKPTIITVVDEPDKSRQPLSVAVDEEITMAIQRRHVTASEDNDNDEDCNEAQTLHVDDLLGLIYFGSMFDMKPIDWSLRLEERSWCLAHDAFHHDAGVILGEEELDAISNLSSLMIARPVDCSLVSHKEALQRCIEHANRWICKSEKRIDPNCDLTYADVREMLTKIMGLGYFEDTPAAGGLKYRLFPDHSIGSTLKLEQQELKMSRQPLSVAVDEEIMAALQRRCNHNDEEKRETNPSPLPVDDLLALIYFGRMFDLKPVDFYSRWEEREYCWMDDEICHNVHHDTTAVLGMEQFDAISNLSSLMISRPADSSLVSHKDSLQRCIEHANRWICKSEKRIDPNCDLTYADVREMLTKIMGLGYFEDTPAAEGNKYQTYPDDWKGYAYDSDSEEEEEDPGSDYTECDSYGLPLRDPYRHFEGYYDSD